MSEFELHKYSAMAYDDGQILSFDREKPVTLPDLHAQMKRCTGVSSVQVTNLTQEAFDEFISKYGDNFESIYFFHNTKVKDLSALSQLRKVKYLLFYNIRGRALWDMGLNESLKGVMIRDSKKTLYDLGPLSTAPELEELILLSSMFQKYPVKTIAPLRNCKKTQAVVPGIQHRGQKLPPRGFSVPGCVPVSMRQETKLYLVVCFRCPEGKAVGRRNASLQATPSPHGWAKDDFDFLLLTDELGTPTVSECYPHAIKKLLRKTQQLFLFETRALLYRQILNPFALADHKGADGAFDQVHAGADGEEGDDGKVRKPAQHEGQRHAKHPHKAAVK